MTNIHTSAGPLSPRQMEFFDRQGYLVVEDVFTDADLQPVIDEISAEVDRRARELVKKGELSRPYDEYDFEHRLGMITKETPRLALEIGAGTLSGPAFFELIRHRRLLDIAQQFVGPEIIASSVYRLRPKAPHNPRGAVPWHQDSGYTEPFCDEHLMLTVWLPLVDATQANGCLWVQPGVHKSGVYRHEARKDLGYLIIPDEDRPGAEAVCCPVKKGGVLLLTNLTPHASFENRTDIVRWSMDLRYQSAALPTNYPMTRLADDADRARNPAVPVACYPPEADCLIRSSLRPNEVVRDAATFNRIRQSHRHPGWTNRWRAARA